MFCQVDCCCVCLVLNVRLSFIKLRLGAACSEQVEAEALRVELAELEQKCNLLMEENKELRNRVRRTSHNGSKELE